MMGRNEYMRKKATLQKQIQQLEYQIDHSLTTYDIPEKKRKIQDLEDEIEILDREYSLQSRGY